VSVGSHSFNYESFYILDVSDFRTRKTQWNMIRRNKSRIPIDKVDPTYIDFGSSLESTVDSLIMEVRTLRGKMWETKNSELWKHAGRDEGNSDNRFSV